MDQKALDPVKGPTATRRLGSRGGVLGRPPKAANRRAPDLQRWVEATFGGMTPGQQAAHLALVTPAEVKRAKAMAKELCIVDLGLAARELALVVKAEILAKALGVSRAAAWAAMTRERGELMPYIHQKQAQKAEKAPGVDELPLVFLMGDGEDRDPIGLTDATEQESLVIVDDFPDAAD